ncbi:MAG: metallophosphoesterase family protein [Flavobacteriales bacterium]|nr:metallophosphoesterase family protein [Flavobacteriales bacterium]
MKRIGLLSDTHGHVDDRMLELLRPCDEIWHAGDIGPIEVTDRLEEIKPVRAVFGNIDDHTVRAHWPLHDRFMCEEVDVWMTHIGGYPKRYSREVRDTIKANPPKLFIAGHSHILKVMYDKDLELLHMNPGAAGIHGFHKLRTMLRFTIDGADIKDLEVVELGKRGSWF